MYEQVSPILIPPFVCAPGTSYKDQIAMKIAYIERKKKVEEENVRREELRQ